MKILNNIQGEKIDLSEVDKVDSLEKKLEIEAIKLMKGKQLSQMADMRDSQYYAVVVFGNEKDKTTFLNKIRNEADINGETFIDGYELSSLMGFEIECSASLMKPHFVKQIKVKSNVVRIKSR